MNNKKLFDMNKKGKVILVCLAVTQVVIILLTTFLLTKYEENFETRLVIHSSTYNGLALSILTFIVLYSGMFETTFPLKVSLILVSLILAYSLLMLVST